MPTAFPVLLKVEILPVHSSPKYKQRVVRIRLTYNVSSAAAHSVNERTLLCLPWDPGWHFSRADSSHWELAGKKGKNPHIIPTYHIP